MYTVGGACLRIAASILCCCVNPATPTLSHTWLTRTLSHTHPHVRARLHSPVSAHTPSAPTCTRPAPPWCVGVRRLHAHRLRRRSSRAERSRCRTSPCAEAHAEFSPLCPSPQSRHAASPRMRFAALPNRREQSSCVALGRRANTAPRSRVVTFARSGVYRGTATLTHGSVCPGVSPCASSRPAGTPYGTHWLFIAISRSLLSHATTGRETVGAPGPGPCW